MSFTLDTSHFEISPLKVVARMNMLLISFTRDTSQSPIGPCRLLAHSISFGDSRQVATAPLSSCLSCGENKAWPTQEFGEMEMRRAKKMTWWCHGKGIGACWYITWSLFLLVRLHTSMCARVRALRLTRVHSQHFGEKCSWNSIGTSGAQSCVV